MNDCSDVFALAAEGDERAFETLYRDVAPRARRIAYRIVRDADAADDPAPRAGDDPHGSGPRSASDALATLPPRWRTILWLVEVERYSPAELAAPMAMTPSAVSSLAHRARRALRTAYLAAG